jgi:hypothetical protein
VLRIGDGNHMKNAGKEDMILAECVKAALTFASVETGAMVLTGVS